VDVKLGDKVEQLPLYIGDEPVSGIIRLACPPGKDVEHQGMKVEFVGQIELFYDRGNHNEFVSSEINLSKGGVLTGTTEHKFAFDKPEKQFESHNGINARLRYFVRVSITRQYASDTIQEFDLWVRNYATPPDINNSIKMEVGIEECLHIEFEYASSKFHLKDVIVGKVFFLLVRIKVKHMELALIRRESTGSGPNLYNESETVTKFEIMDGAPVRGECVPVRLFLGGFELTPTYKNINNKFSVRYYLNLVLIDEEDRRYFKQQEVHLWRRDPDSPKEPPRYCRGAGAV